MSISDLPREATSPAVATSSPPREATSQAVTTPVAPPANVDASQLTPLAIVACAVGAGVIAVFWDSLRQLERVWNVDPSYSHGYLVPLACIGFAVLAWKRGKPDFSSTLTSQGMITGAAEVMLGLALHAVGWLLSLLILDVVALICVVRGLLLLLGGPSVNAKWGFAALFLIFMAPLPAIWQQPLALGMQHFVSTISAASLETLGIAAYRQGYMIHLSDYTMEVGEACSGLRQLTAVLALGVAMGELYQGSRPTRWLLALLALPVAVAANCFRVTMSGVIMVFFGAKWAEGVFHTLEGLAVILMAAAALLGIAWGLIRLEKRLGWRTAVGEAE